MKLCIAVLAAALLTALFPFPSVAEGNEQERLTNVVQVNLINNQLDISFAAGMIGFICKPMDASHLYEELGNALKHNICLDGHQ